MNNLSKSQKKLEIEDIEIRGRLGIEDIVRRQIDRCNFSSPYPDEFSANVNALFDILPTHKRNELKDREVEYCEVVNVVHYKYWCGVPMTATKTIVPTVVVNYHKFYQMILTALEESRLTYQTETKLFEIEKITKERIIETPKIPDPVKPEDLEVIE